jgi:polysaccharide pyruvyl transferase WcaK-like protein
MNLGDEAILHCILGRLRATIPADVVVFSHNPADTLGRHAVEHAVNVRSLTRREAVREIADLDMLILGGGGILYDRDAPAYLREVFIAHEHGVPVFVYAISAGPLLSEISRSTVRDALNDCAAVTVRDRLGYRLLEDVGVTQKIHLTADPALLLEPEELPVAALESEGVQLGHTLVGFSVREPGPAAPDIDPDEYYALLAQAADFIVDRSDGEDRRAT